VVTPSPSGASEMPSQPVTFDLSSLGLTSVLSLQIRDRIAAAEATKNQVLDFELLPAPPAAIPSGETISREEALSPIFLELSDLELSDIDAGLGSDVFPITDPASGVGALDLLLGGGDGIEGNVSFLPGNGLSTVDIPSAPLEDFALTTDFASGFTSSGSLDLDVSAADPLLSAIGLTAAEGPLVNIGLFGLFNAIY
jgi:hypothetical protein